MPSFIAVPTSHDPFANMAPQKGSLFGSIKAKLTRKSTDGSDRSLSRSSTANSSNSKAQRSSRHAPSNPVSPISPAPQNSNYLSPYPVASNMTSGNDPPPAYTAAAQSSSAPSGAAELPATTPSANSSRTSLGMDDRYSFLRTFDTKFLIDDSGSMIGRSWRETREALAAITPICTQYDADGIDIHFLNAKDSEFFCNVKTPSTVHEIFESVRPRGGTPTGLRLMAILRPYVNKYLANPERTKPLNIIVITDGEPSDDVESSIIWAAKKLDRVDAPAWQIGIQFFQVGNEPGAREHLKQLDDDLAELAGDDDMRDIVDTVPWTAANGGVLNPDGILKVVLGAVTRRLDKSRVKIHT